MNPSQRRLTQGVQAAFLYNTVKEDKALTDAVTKAYVNMYAIMGTLEDLCRLVPAAGALVSNAEPVSVCFSVSGGPHAAVTFADGACCLKDDISCEECDIIFEFSSCDDFNGMLAGTVQAAPIKGAEKMDFLAGTFLPLMGLMAKYLSPSEGDMADEAFFSASTTLTLYVIAASIPQLAAHDEISIFSADHTPNGDMLFGVQGGPLVTFRVKDHKISLIKEPTENPCNYQTFANMQVAHEVFSGTADSVAYLGLGLVSMGGLIAISSSIGRIMDRVGIYL